MKTVYIIRAHYCQPDGIGYLGKDGCVYRDSRYAVKFEWEGEAWDVALASPYWGRDEEKGEWLYVEGVDIPG